MAQNSIIIQNPLPFMLESFMKKKVLKGKYASGKIKQILLDDFLNKLIISFEEEELANSFINDYNGKYFDDKFNYELKIEKCIKTVEEIQKEVDEKKRNKSHIISKLNMKTNGKMIMLIPRKNLVYYI